MTGPDLEEENSCLDETLYDVRAILFASNPEILGLGVFISDSRDYLVKRSLWEYRKHPQNPCGAQHNVPWQLAPKNGLHLYDLC